MNVLVTGGAGFIGRWVVKRLLSKGSKVIVFDNLSNGSLKNIEEFRKNKNFSFVKGDVANRNAVKKVFRKKIDSCIHLAAQINVQESIDHPERAFTNNLVGTFNVLEECHKRNIKLTIVGTCMVYDTAIGKAIGEEHPVKPASPYAATKLGAEDLALSYYHSYGLPVVVVRPFNTYGPFQKSNLEGGVVSVFVGRELKGEKLLIFGDGRQTRDLLYVEDSADFIVQANMKKAAVGHVINAGSGRDISVNKLALSIAGDKKKIKHIPHIHPQAEISKLLCDPRKAKKLLGWRPKVRLEEGIKRTRAWLESQ